MTSTGLAGTTVVFDLDGTLLETAPDLIAAVNHCLEHAGGAPITTEELRNVVSFGGREMIRSGFKMNGLNASEAALDKYFPMFVDYYRANIAVHTQPFPGLVNVLDMLADQGAIVGVCTNKLEGLTRPLLDALDMTHRFAAITGRDTFPVHKPDPRHLLGTIERAGGDPARAVMVGDSNTDVQTAKSAGVPVIGVTFGYTDTPMSELDSDAVISHYDSFEPALRQIGAFG